MSWLKWRSNLRCFKRNLFFFQAEDGIRDGHVTGVQTCALPIWLFAADADEWDRVNIHPVSGEILTVDRYKPRSEERRVGEERRSRRAPTRGRNKSEG